MSTQFEPLLTAKALAQLLGFSGNRPEQGVYKMVRDGRIPKDCIVQKSERHFLFHPDRIRQIINQGGFKKEKDSEAGK